MNNSQFWTWVDYWECWDFMQDELEDELELEDWADEALWLICLKCGNPLEGCVCEVSVPTSTSSRASSTPSSEFDFACRRDFT